MDTGTQQFNDNAGAAPSLSGEAAIPEAGLDPRLLKALEVIAQLTQQRDAALAVGAAQKPAEKLAEPTAKPKIPGATESHASSPERWRVIIAESQDPFEMGRVFVGCNGRGYWYKRGVPVDVPREVVKILDNAVTAKAIPIIDENTGFASGVELRESRRFPYQMLGKSVDISGNPIAMRSALESDALPE